MDKTLVCFDSRCRQAGHGGPFRTKMRGNAQRMVTLPSTTDANMLWQYAKFLLPWQQESTRASLNVTIKLSDR